MKEDRSQKSEDGGQKAEIKGHGAKGMAYGAEERGQKTEGIEVGLRPVGAIGACAPEGIRNAECGKRK